VFLLQPNFEIRLGLGTHLFVKLSCSFQSSNQADTCYYQSNHSKVERPSRIAQGHNKRTCRSIFKLSLFMLNI